MKIVKKLAIMICLATITLSSCEEEGCMKGVLRLHNATTNEDKMIIINNYSYGIIAAGQSQDVHLCPGIYVIEISSADGGCTEELIIHETEVTEFECEL